MIHLILIANVYITYNNAYNFNFHIVIQAELKWMWLMKTLDNHVQGEFV